MSCFPHPLGRLCLVLRRQRRAGQELLVIAARSNLSYGAILSPGVSASCLTFVGNIPPRRAHGQRWPRALLLGATSCVLPLLASPPAWLWLERGTEGCARCWLCFGALVGVVEELAGSMHHWGGIWEEDNLFMAHDKNACVSSSRAINVHT